LLRIIRRRTRSVVTWRQAQMVLLSAQGMDVPGIAEVSFTSAVRDVLHNFNADGFASLYPKYRGGRPRIFTLPGRREIKKIARSKPAEHGLPFSTWSLVKLADFLVAEGVVDDISHEGLRILLHEKGVSLQRIKTWKTSRDPDYAAGKARVEHLYAIADGEVIPEPGEPDVVFLHGRVRAAQPPARYPADVRIAIVCDNFSPHLTTKRCRRAADRGGEQRRGRLHPGQLLLAEPHRGPAHRIGYSALDGTGHPSHKAQGSMIRRYIIWRNNHAAGRRLREVVARANVA
jgi:transposase